MNSNNEDRENTKCLEEVILRGDWLHEWWNVWFKWLEIYKFLSPLGLNLEPPTNPPHSFTTWSGRQRLKWLEILPLFSWMAQVKCLDNACLKWKGPNLKKAQNDWTIYLLNLFIGFFLLWVNHAEHAVKRFQLVSSTICTIS